MLFYWVLFGLCFPKFFRNYDNGQDSTGRDQEDEKGLSYKDCPYNVKKKLIANRVAITKTHIKVHCQLQWFKTTCQL